MLERNIEDPSVQAILSYSEKLLDSRCGFGPFLSHVGESTIVINEYMGSRGGSDRTYLVLGIVTPDGKPFVPFLPLSMVPDQEKTLQYLQKLIEKHPNVFGDENAPTSS